MLCAVTERLARELAHPTVDAPRWTASEWQVARAVAVMHGVSPVLAKVLRWDGPEHWRRFLDHERAETAARHQRIEQLLQMLDEVACARGIALMALKGAELHRRGICLPGDRPMSDVDLLVRSPERQAAREMLQAIGYQRSYVTAKHEVFVPTQAGSKSDFGEDHDRAIKIELHDHIAEVLPHYESDITGAVASGRWLPGVRGYSSDAALMAHLLLHAAGNMSARALRLMHLYDMALLSRRMTAADWHRVLTGMDPQGCSWWAVPVLGLARQYFDMDIPASPLHAATMELPRMLRWRAKSARLCDVSISRLWVSRAPGLPWSRSMQELARYLWRRLHPDRAFREVLQVIAQQTPWIGNSPWFRSSRVLRAVRLLLSRVPSPSTIHMLRRSAEYRQQRLDGLPGMPATHQAVCR